MLARGKRRTNIKGCDIGYALAANPCEGVHSVEACTVTAFDAITAFTVPNPNFSSQSRRIFQVWVPFELPRRADYSVYFGLATFILANPFDRRRSLKYRAPEFLSMPFFGAIVARGESCAGRSSPAALADGAGMRSGRIHRLASHGLFLIGLGDAPDLDAKAGLLIRGQHIP
jgi:hypothetical protein